MNKYDNLTGYIDNIQVSKYLKYPGYTYKCNVKFLSFVLDRYSMYEFSNLEDALRSEDYILSKVPKLIRSLCTVKWTLKVKSSLATVQFK